MKRQVKRFLSISLVLVMMLSLLPVAAFAVDTTASGTCGDNMTWQLDSNGVLSIKGTGDMWDFWAQLLPPWRTYRDSIQTINIQHGVTSIGSYAFWGLPRYSTIDIPDSVTSISNDAFNGAKGLTQVIIPNSVTSIGQGAFSQCTGLTSIVIPERVVSMEGDTFFNCTNLSTVDILGEIKSISTATFYGCSSLSSITIPDSVTSVGAGAFYGCSSLASIAIPDGVTSIETDTFFNCTSLSEVDILGEITSVAAGAFSGTPWQKRLGEFPVINGILFGYQGTNTDIIIPNSVTSVGTSAFSGCRSLKSVTIPDSVTSIGDSAFYNCDNLTTVHIGNSVKSIGKSAFNSCYLLTEIVLPDGITKIGEAAFENCDKQLSSIAIPQNVLSIGERAFNGCTNLTSITVNSANPNYSSDSAGVLFNKSKTNLLRYPAGRSDTNYSIPDTVTNIQDYAFTYSHNLTKILIPNSVVNIGRAGFYFCKKLTEVHIPSSMRYIGDIAFRSCDSLYDVFFFGDVPEIAGGFSSFNQFVTLHYPRNASGWTTPTWNGYKTEPYQDGLSTSIFPEYKTHLKFYIYDTKTRLPIEGANVSVLAPTNYSKSERTDETGAAALSILGYSIFDNLNNFSLTVSASNYNSYKNFQYKYDGAETVYTIGLDRKNPQGELVSTLNVMYDLGGTLYSHDVLRETVVLSPSDVSLVKIVATAENPANVARFDLLEDDFVLCSSDTGDFGDVELNSIANESQISVRTVAKNGYISSPQETRFQSESAISGDGVASFGGMDSIKIEIPKDIPLLGGMELKLDLGALPFKMQSENGKFKMGINVGSGELKFNGSSPSSETTSIFQEDVWNNYKDSVLEKIDPEKALSEYLKKDVSSFLKSQDLAEFGTGKIKYSVWGYLEGDDKHLSGVLAIEVSASAKLENQFFLGPIPCVFTIELEGGIKDGKLSCTYHKNSSENNPVISISGSMSPYIKLEGGAGVGLAKVAHITGGASGELKNAMAWNASGDFSQKLTLGLEGFIKAKVLFFEYKLPIANKEWTLYPTTHTRSTQDTPVQFLSDINQYEISDRDYVEKQSSWLGEQPKAAPFTLKGTVAPVEYTLLQDSIYGDARAQVVSAQGTTMLFFITDSANRTDLDRTMLVCSTYNAANDTWSDPKAVADDGTADFLPIVTTDGTDIYVSWVNMNQSLGVYENQPFEELSSRGEICVAKYNWETDAFEVVQITEDGLLDTMPNLYIDGGTTYSAWVKNSSGNMLCNDDANTICLYASDVNTTSIIAESVRNITDLVVGKLGEEIILAYISDQDGDLMTDGDKVLQVVDTSGRVLRETNIGSYANLKFLGDQLTWYEGGCPVVIDSAAGESMPLLGFSGAINSDYQFLETDDNIYLTCIGSVQAQQEGSSSKEVFTYVYDKASATWGAASQTTAMGQDIQTVSTFLKSDQSLGAVITAAQMSGDGTELNPFQQSVALYAMRAIPMSNYALKDVSYRDIEIDETGYFLAFRSTVQNTGSAPGGTYRLELRNSGGAVIDQFDCGGILLAGQEAELQGIFRLPELPAPESTYSVALILVEGDYDDTNKEQNITLGRPNIALNYTSNEHGEISVIAAQVNNHGFYDSEVSVNLRANAQDGEILESIPLGNLAAGESKTVIFSIDGNKFIRGNQTNIIYIEAAIADEEVLTADNYEFYVIKEVKHYEASIALNNTEMTLEKAASAQLAYSIENDRLLIDQAVVWTSSDATIASVDEYGVVSALREGTAVITVSVENGQYTDTCLVTVLDGGSGSEEIESISVQEPTKTDYLIGQLLETAGMSITVTYHSGHTEVITPKDIELWRNVQISGFDSSVSAEHQTITVSYGGASDTFWVDIADNTLHSVAIISNPIKMSYTAFETLDLTGMVVTATYDDGTTVLSSEDYAIEYPQGRSSFRAGDSGVTIRYSGQSAELSGLVVSKATLDVSSVSWGTQTVFPYDGDVHAVSLTNLPDGLTVDSYTDHEKTYTGNYTAVAKFSYDSSNYELSSEIAPCEWSIVAADQILTITHTANLTAGGSALDLSTLISTPSGGVTFTILGESSGCSVLGNILTSGNTTGEIRISVTIASRDIDEDGFPEYNAFADAIVVTIVELPVPSAPNVEFSFTGAKLNRLMGATIAMEYSLDGGTTFSDCTDDIDLGDVLARITAENDIRVRVKKTSTTAEGNMQIIDIIPGATVTGVSAAGCTTSANDDGKLIGMTNTMEYRKGGTIVWNAGTGVPIEGLTPGDYQVRVKADGLALPGTVLTATVTAASVAYHSIIYTLTNLSGNGALTVPNSTALAFELVANTGYNLPETISISMAGNMLMYPKEYTYSKDTGAVRITAVIGDVVITATGSSQITHIESINLNKTDATLIVGDNMTLIAAVTPSDATNKAVTWSTSDAAVATVADGVVTAVKVGTAIVTATTEDGGFSVSCNVIVKSPQPVSPPFSGGNTPSTTVTETEKNEDGSTTEIVTDKKTGNMTSTTTYPDGTKIVAAMPKDGKTTIEVTVPKGKERVTITIPTATQPKLGEVAVIVKPDGTREVVKSSVTTSDGLRLTLTENAKLEIVDNSKSFGDIPTNKWFTDAVQFVASRELFSGTSKDSFSPESDMTRGMLVTVLARFDGRDTAKGESWDSVGIAWAKETGISDGTGMKDSITREQLAVMLYRYAKAEKLDGMALEEFSDAADVSAWAKDAMRWAVKSGIVNGAGGKLNPTATASRAEVAAMLQRFVAGIL